MPRIGNCSTGLGEACTRKRFGMPKHQCYAAMMISIVIMHVVASCVAQELVQEQYLFQHQCHKMPCVLTPTVQVVFREWARLRLIEVRGLWEVEIDRVKTQLRRHTKEETKSIWKMREDGLVEEANKVLGWSHGGAHKPCGPMGWPWALRGRNGVEFASFGKRVRT